MQFQEIYVLVVSVFEQQISIFFIKDSTFAQSSSIRAV